MDFQLYPPTKCSFAKLLLKKKKKVEKRKTIFFLIFFFFFFFWGGGAGWGEMQWRKQPYKINLVLKKSKLVLNSMRWYYFNYDYTVVSININWSKAPTGNWRNWKLIYTFLRHNFFYRIASWSLKGRCPLLYLNFFVWCTKCLVQSNFSCCFCFCCCCKGHIRFEFFWIYRFEYFFSTTKRFWCIFRQVIHTATLL